MSTGFKPVLLLAPVLAMGCLPPGIAVTRCDSSTDCPASYRCTPLHYCEPLGSDGGLVVEDGGADAGTVLPCLDDGVCDDNNPCNGVERCNPSTMLCGPATVPWPGYHDGESCGASLVCRDGLCTDRSTDCVNQLALGASHSCALGGDGTVLCWGRNHAGQLGDGTQEPRSAPTPVTGLNSVVAIAAGFDFSCALLEDGGVRCWGANASGQLGDGSRQPRLRPVAVNGLAPVLALAAGKYHACALQQDGLVLCWGDDENGQLGDGQQWTSSTQPVPVPLSFDPLALAAGGYHTCALDDLGRVWCWGARWSGQTGTQVSQVNELSPTRIDSLTGVLRIAAGEGHSCAVRSDQTLWCWGDSRLTRAGPDLTDDASPAQVADLAEVIDVDTSMYHICVRLLRGGVKCWGYNREGQLGDGSRTSRDEPGTTLQLSTDDTREVRAGGTHSCARMRQGTTWCWGDGTWGQIGEGSLQSTASVSGVLLASVQEIHAGIYHTCMRQQGGQVACTGWNQRGQLGVSGPTLVDTPQILPTLDAVTALATGPLHSCAVRGNRVLCWGANDAGQLGLVDHLDRSSPQEVPGVDNVAELALGYGFSCALNHTGEVWCWGANGHGELGHDVAGGSNSPLQVSLGGPAEQISARIWTACARLEDGTGWCWGYNRQGQAGQNHDLTDAGYDGLVTPRQLAIAGGVVDISAGGDHGCAVDSLGQAWCWGGNSLGALGTGNRSSSDTPLAVVDVGPVVDIESSWNNSCAIDATGALWCWGANDAAELGNDYGTRDRPVQVLNLTGVAQLTAGELHTCVVTSQGAAGNAAYCWGQSAYGQIGNGSSSTSLRPVEVMALRCP